MTTRNLSIILTSACVAILGCGSDDEQARPAAERPPTATAPAATAPYGTYVRQVSQQDLARTAELRGEYGPNQQLPPRGRYRLVIAQGAGQDVLKAVDPEGFTIAQDITAQGRRIRLTSYVDPAKASFCGPEIAAQAEYAASANGDELVLKPASPDPCADRDSILTGTWRKE